MYGLAAAALTVILGLPFRSHDTAALLPIRTVQVAMEDGLVHIVSEVGEGTGKSWTAAVEDLRANAPGEVFFDTAEQIVFCNRAETIAETVAQSGELRPAAQVYFADELRDPENLNALLSAHESGQTLAMLGAETVK